DWGANLARHRQGSMSHKVLFEGDEGSPDNFLFVLANEGSDYYSPRHRHAWDQVRFCLTGAVPIARDVSVDAGETAYFPEGVHYGPQSGGPDRLVLLLQFGGASGRGYLSMAQLRSGHEALLEEGRFEKGVFRRERGEGRLNQDAYEAIWNKVTGRDIDYPIPRYKTPIVMRPEAFDWRTAEAGVRTRALGRFPERDLALDMIALDAGAAHAFGGSTDRRLVFVLRGDGRCGEAGYSAQTAVRLEPGEAAGFAAATDTELFCIAYPLVAAKAKS
ncbi:MAG: hypothetical protein ABIO37_04785, partial [Caulobacteraceae bacterium]